MQSHHGYESTEQTGAVTDVKIDFEPELSSVSVEGLQSDTENVGTEEDYLYDEEQILEIDPLHVVNVDETSESDVHQYSSSDCDEPSIEVEARKKRSSFTIQRKLQIISEYEKGVSGKGLKNLARKYEIATSTLQGWVHRKNQLEAIVYDRSRSSKRQRRLPGGGQKPLYPELEDRLINWIKQCNKNGIRVTDRLILIQASNLAAELDIDCFKKSNGWLDRFKRRQNLVSRCETTCRVLPANGLEKINKFFEDVRAVINERGVEPQNILNMDQVPRYYQAEQSSTITSKGSKSVLLRKATSTHKKFTATFTINAAGEMLKPHCLFADLKKLPLHDEHVMVAVNETGMWSAQIFKDYMKNIVMNRYQTTLLRQPVLLIVDSYGPHINVAEEMKAAYKRKNIFIVLVPPGMTPLLQPLDVSVNKSFQTAYSESYSEYIKTALMDSTKHRTSRGNIKNPAHLMATEWVWKWAKQDHKDLIKNSFKICGIYSGDLDKQLLHPPLRAVMSDEFDMQDWLHRYSKVLQQSGEESDCIPNVFPVNVKMGFYECVHKLTQRCQSFDQWIKDFIPKVCDYVQSQWDILIQNESDKLLLLSGKISTGAEIAATAELLNVKILLVECSLEGYIVDTTTYKPKVTSNNSITILKSGKYFMAFVEQEDANSKV